MFSITSKSRRRLWEGFSLDVRMTSTTLDRSGSREDEDAMAPKGWGGEEGAATVLEQKKALQGAGEGVGRGRGRSQSGR